MWTIEPVEGQDYEGRQWGYTLNNSHGDPEWHVVTGGTGDCWNIESADDMGDERISLMHVCELDELIEALIFLRDSEENRQHVARWAA